MKKKNVNVLIVGDDSNQAAIEALKKIATSSVTPILVLPPAPTLCACCGVNPVNLLDGDSTICGDCTGKM